MPHQKVRAVLGGHRFEARHEVASSLGGQPEQSLTEEVHLACRAQGDCHGRLHNSKEYGVEFVRLGEETYFRHRYQEYLKFTEERDEAERRVEHLFGIGGAVLELLARGVRLEPAGEAAVEGRKATRYRLLRRRLPRPGGAARGPAKGPRAWRAKLTVEEAGGEVWLDRATGAPLHLEVRYRVSAPKGKSRVVLAGSLVADVKSIGKPPSVKPPERFAEASPRERELLDVRALLGDQRLNPGWFRGGGPHAARERQLGIRPSPRAARPAAMLPGASRPAAPAPGTSRPASAPPRAPRAAP